MQRRSFVVRSALMLFAASCGGPDPKPPAVTFDAGTGTNPGRLSCEDLGAGLGLPCDIANLGGATSLTNACTGTVSATSRDAAERGLQCIADLGDARRCDRPAVEQCLVSAFDAVRTDDADRFCSQHRGFCAADSSFVRECPRVIAAVPGEARARIDACLRTLTLSRCHVMGLLACLRTRE